MLGSVLNQILQAQASEQLQAGPYERTEERQGYRNGTYPHKLTTRVGSLTLRIPRLRNGEFSTEMFARYQRSEQALVLAMMEMVINEVSTRKVATVTEELCGVRFSKSTVSELCKNLDPLVESWNHRPLTQRYDLKVVDAMVTKVREEGWVRMRGLLIPFGVNMQGYREILGFWVGDSESEASGGILFRSETPGLKRSGVNRLRSALRLSESH